MGAGGPDDAAGPTSHEPQLTELPIPDLTWWAERNRGRDPWADVYLDARRRWESRLSPRADRTAKHDTPIRQQHDHTNPNTNAIGLPHAAVTSVGKPNSTRDDGEVAAPLSPHRPRGPSATLAAGSCGDDGGRSGMIGG